MPFDVPNAGVTSGAATRADLIRMELVDDLYRRAVPALIGFGVTLAILASLVVEKGGTYAGLVVAAIAVIVVLRLALTLTDRRGRGPFRSTRAREIAFLTGVAMTGLGLATLNVTVYHEVTPAQSALLGAFQTGAMAAALASMGSSSIAFMLYAIPNLGSLLVMTALDRRGWGEETFLLLQCAYLPALLLVAYQQSLARRRTAGLELELAEHAMRDALTGLFNRRFFGILLDKEAAIAENSCHMQDRRKPMRATALGLLVVDVDRFKGVNDTHGHAAGDAVLRAVGAALKGGLRPCDEVVRWGGEEFVVVLRLPWEDRDRVGRVADRLLAAVRDHVFQIGGGVELRCTVSIGYTLHPLSDRLPTLLPWATTLTLADAALYLAKNEGRDRAVGVIGGARLDERAAEAAALIVTGLAAAAEGGVVQVVRDA